MSFQSLGLLTHLLSKPTNWQVKLKCLERPGLNGRGSIRGAIRELESLGYIRREHMQDPETGHMLGWSFDVFEEPQPPRGSPINRPPINGSPMDGFPLGGEPPPSNKDSSNKEKSKTPLSSDGAEEIFPEPEEPTPEEPATASALSAAQGLPDPGGSDFPRVNGHPDWLTAVKTLDSRAAAAFCLALDDVNNPVTSSITARKYVKRRYGGLDEKSAVVVSRGVVPPRKI